MHLVPIELKGKTSAPLQGAAEVITQVLEANASLYERRGHVPPWTGYLAVVDGEIVGTCGFAGPPSAGEVEVAYFTFPGSEGKGVAKTMLRNLLDLTRPVAQQLGVQYIAHTLPDEGPSTSILKALHFQLVGEVQHPEDGLVWKWREHTPSEA
jgi:ribosomal-protein-alanine N-acetyltransferase